MITVTITRINEIAKVLYSMHLPGLVMGWRAISPTLGSCERGHNHLSLPVQEMQLSLHLPRLCPCRLWGSGPAGASSSLHFPYRLWGSGHQEPAPSCISHADCGDQVSPKECEALHPTRNTTLRGSSYGDHVAKRSEGRRTQDAEEWRKERQL